MSHEDKSVTPVTTDSNSGHHYFGQPRYGTLPCSGVCDLDCELERTGILGLRIRFFPGELGPGEPLKPANTITCVILLEAAAKPCGLTLSEFQDIILSLRLALGSPGDV